MDGKHWSVGQNASVFLAFIQIQSNFNLWVPYYIQNIFQRSHIFLHIDFFWFVI